MMVLVGVIVGGSEDAGFEVEFDFEFLFGFELGEAFDGEGVEGGDDVLEKGARISKQSPWMNVILSRTP